MESAIRRSGRTARMLKAAMAAAMAGFHVYVIVHNRVMFEYVHSAIIWESQRLGLDVTHRLNRVSLPGGSVTIETKDVYYSLEWRRGRNLSHVFIDHAVYELEAEQRIDWDFGARDWHSSHATFIPSDAKLSRDARFDALRAEGKKLGEINTILESEGYSEVFGEGVMPCPTKHHEIIRENTGVRKLIEALPGGVT